MDLRSWDKLQARGRRLWRSPRSGRDGECPTPPFPAVPARGAGSELTRRERILAATRSKDIEAYGNQRARNDELARTATPAERNDLSSRLASDNLMPRAGHSAPTCSPPPRLALPGCGARHDAQVAESLETHSSTLIARWSAPLASIRSGSSGLRSPHR